MMCHREIDRRAQQVAPLPQERSLLGRTSGGARPVPFQPSRAGALLERASQECDRLQARNVLWEWGLDRLALVAELLVAELMTSAVKATAPRNEAE